MNEQPLIKRDVESRTSWVQHVSLTDFRNYRELALDLDPGFNIVQGANGQGKTNLLEALYLISTSRLLRGHKDAEAITHGCSGARVSVEISPSETKLGVKLERGVRKRATLNDLALPRASDLLGRLPCVCISTLDMEIVRGDPSERRMFLDLELSALRRAYLQHLAVYKRALEQRNSLLKEAQERHVGSHEWEVWEEQLAASGAQIRSHRREYVETIRPDVVEFHGRMGAGETIHVDYRQRDEAANEAGLREQLARCRASDTTRGSTTVGPHRDDLGILIQAAEARLFGSQGQQRTAVVAIKMATLLAMSRQCDESPLLLLDDIFSDLDPERRKSLVQIVLEAGGQSLLTCTDTHALDPELISRATMYEAAGGQVRPL
jgi:DNA replication and repair protein RecF